MSEQTKAQLRGAFQSLIAEKPFDRIRIRDIVERCGYNRNTFYYYYQDIYELVEDVMLEQARTFSRNVRGGSPWNREAAKLTVDLKCSRAYSNLYRFIERADMEKFMFRVCDEMVGSVIDCKSEGIKVDAADLRLIRTFYRCAVAGIILEWMDSGMKTEAEDLLTRVDYLMGGGIESAIENARTN